MSEDFLNNQFYSFDAPSDFNFNQGDNFQIPIPGDYITPCNYITPDNCITPSNYITPGNYNAPGNFITPDNYIIPGNYNNPGNYNTSRIYHTPGEHNTPGNLSTPGNHNSHGNHEICGNYNTPGDHDTPGRHRTPGNYNTSGNNYNSPGNNNTSSNYNSPGNCTTFGNYNTPGISYNNPHGRDNIPPISSSSPIQQPKKFVILKPVNPKSTTKSDLKYTIIRSFTPSRRTYTNASMRSGNNETETIAQKIPISLAQMIVDVAKPKINNNTDQNVEADRSTVLPVKEFPPHVQNVIGGLTKNGNTPASRPLVVDASKFQNNANTTNMSSNFPINSSINNRMLPSQHASSWRNSWKNSYFGQPIRSSYSNNVGVMRTDYSSALHVQKSQSMSVWPTNNPWTPSSFSNELTTFVANPKIAGIAGTHFPNNTRNIAETSKLSNSATNDSKIDNNNNFGSFLNCGNWGASEKLPVSTHTLNSPSNSTPPQKLNKSVPTIITGTKIIPSVLSPIKTRLNNFQINNSNKGQSKISCSSLISKNSGSIDSNKKSSIPTLIPAHSNEKSVGGRNLISNNYALGSNIDPFGRKDSKNDVCVPSFAEDVLKIESEPKFVDNQHFNAGLKIINGRTDSKSNFTPLKFNNTINFPSKPLNHSSMNPEMLGNIDDKNIFPFTENSTEFMEKPNAITHNNFNSFTEKPIINDNFNSYPKFVGSMGNEKTFPDKTRELMNELSAFTNDIDSKTKEDADKYFIITSSPLHDNCEKILPINSEEEELLNTPDCAFDNSFNIDIPNVSNTVNDVFGAYNNTNSSQSNSISSNVSKNTGTADFSFNASLDIPMILGNDCEMKDEVKEFKGEIKNVEQNSKGCCTENAILPDYQQVPEDLSFGFIEEQPQIPVEKLEECGDKDFDLDSLLKDKKDEFETMGKEGIDKEGEKIDKDDESCTNIIKEKTIIEDDSLNNLDNSLKKEQSLDLSSDQDFKPVFLPCGLCELMFQDKPSLKAHLKTHSKENNYVCEICDRSFKQETTLRNHFSRSHTMAGNNYKCNVCEETFSVWRMLRNHRETVHPSPDKHRCYICEKVFPNKTALKAHVQRHTDPRRYRCQYCDKVYKDRAGLNVHLVVHTQVSKFSCNLCDRKFGKKNLLTDHMKIFHLKQKDHTCHECNRAFSTKNTLKRHSWIHTGEKNYICEICGRPFRQKVALTVHMKVHNKPPKPHLEPYHSIRMRFGNNSADSSFGYPGIKYRFENDNNSFEPKCKNLVSL